MKQAPKEIDSELVDAARRVLPVFSGGRLVAMRELLGHTQQQVAAAARITASALSQAERDRTTPSAANLARLSMVLGVNPDAFAERTEPDVALAPQFRHLRRTPKREQNRAGQLVRATVSVAEVLRSEVEFPAPFEFAHHVDPDASLPAIAASIEEAAAKSRDALGLSPAEPVGESVIACLEAGGITVVRDPETDHNIDAFSAVVGGLPVIVLDGGTGSVWD